MPEREPILSARDVSRAYANGDTVTQVLHDVNLHVYEGELLVLLGESGSGKTTLMHILAGMDAPTSGCVEFKGGALTGASEQELATYRRAHVGFVFQSHNLMPNLTTRQNVQLAAELVSDPLSSDEALALVGLKDYGDRLPSELSGGQRQRVAIARALVKQPQIIFADEPTAALDHESSAEVLDVIRRVASAGTTVVMVTHDEQVCELADRVARIRDGRLTEVTERVSGEPEAEPAPTKEQWPRYGWRHRTAWVADLLTTIRATIVPFLSVLAFALLGVGMFLGVQWVSHSLTQMADQMMAEAQGHDVEITFPYGLTQDDLAQLAALEGVDDVEARYLGYRQISSEEGDLVLRVESLPRRIDRLVDVEGHLPRNEHEIALDRAWATSRGLSVGSTVTFDDAADGAQASDSKEASSSKDSSASKDAKSASDSQALPSAGDAAQQFLASSYTVSALVSSPSFICSDSYSYGSSPTASGAVDGLAWVTEDAFNQDAYYGARPYVVLRSQALEGLPSFDEAYRTRAAELKARVSELGDKLANQRFSQLYQEHADLVADAEKRLAEARKQLSEGQAQVEQGTRELEEGRSALEQQRAAAQRDLASARSQLDAGKRAYDAALAEHRQAQAQFDEAQQAVALVEQRVSEAQGLISSYGAELQRLQELWKSGAISFEQYRDQIDSAGAAVTAELAGYGVTLPFPLNVDFAEQFLAQEGDILERVRKLEFSAYGYTLTLDSAPGVMSGVQAQLDAAAATLAQTKARLDQAEAELAEAQARYERESARAQELLDASERELAQSREQLSAGEKEIQEKDAELAEGREALDQLRTYRWVVLERSYNGGMLVLDSYVYIMRNVRWTMALPFLVVGLLVCYAAVGRMVHDHQELIGTKKAMGFTQAEVTSFYLAYSGLAVLLGVALAVPLALYVVQGVIASALGAYFVRPFEPFLQPSDIAVLGLVQLGLIGLSTWVTTSHVVRRQAADLLSGETPSAAHGRFYERWKLWKRLGLLGQTIVSNCVNDVRRVVATVVGVAGCAALVVTAVTLYDNVYRSNQRMNEAVFHYDTIVCIDQTEQALKDTRAALEGAGMVATPVYSSLYTLEQPDGKLSTANVIVPADLDEFAGLYSTRIVGERTDEHGMIINMSYRDHLGAQLGDEVILTDAMGNSHTLPISGFFEYYYALCQIIMEPELFEQSFADLPVPNRLFVDSKGQGAARVSELLEGVEGYQATINNYENLQSNFNDFFTVARAVVGVYLALAAVMAFVVLLNLDVMMVNEKKRELVVLMVNGFSVRQAKAYIWHDAVLLTLLGILCGLVLGGVLGQWTVLSVESRDTLYMHDVSWLAMGLGALVSAVFSAMALLIALRRIPKLQLSDLNRL